MNVLKKSKHKTMPYQCRDCRKWFSVRTGTPMQSSKIGYHDWLTAMYLQSTSLKGVSSKKLHCDLGISQKAAWHLAHRIREMWRRDETKVEVFQGPIEGDEAWIGGKVSKMSASRRKKFKGQGPFANKIAVAGVKDRHTKRVRIRIVGTATGEALRKFVERHRDDHTLLYTDESAAYDGLGNHAAVKHRAREYVRGPDPHERHRIVLEHAEARLHRHVPPDVVRAHGPVRDRVRSQAQLPQLRHDRPDSPAVQGRHRPDPALRQTHRAR